MKVLYIAPEYPGNGENAAQVRANAMLPRLAKHVELHVVCFPPHEGFDKTNILPDVTYVTKRKMTFVDFFRGTFSTSPRAFQRFNSQSAIDRLLRILADFQPDIVHFDSVAVLGLLDVVTRLPKPPLVVAHTHDAVSQLYKSRIKNAKILGKLDTWNEYRKLMRVEKTVLPKTDLVIVDSEEDATFLASQAAGNHVVTLPLGFDPEVFTPEGPKAKIDNPAIVFSGAMSGVQSIDGANYLVDEIMPKVWETHPNCTLYLVGNNPAKEILALQSDRICVTGFVEDLGSYLRAADLYVCPLRVGSGMRTRVIEALACGAVIIATPFAMRGLTHDSSAEVPWMTTQSASEFADLITSNLDMDQTELKLGAANFAAKHYSWDHVVGKLVDEYDSILAKNSNRAH